MSETRRTLGWLVIMVLLLAAVGGGYVAHLWQQSDQLVDRLLRDHLQTLAPGWDIRFSRCRFDFLRRVRIDDVVLTDGHSDKPLLVIPRLVVSIDRDALSNRQQLVVQRVSVHDARVLLERDADGRWNWQRLPDLPWFNGSLPEWVIEHLTVDTVLASSGGRPAGQRTISDVSLKLVPASRRGYVVELDAGLGRDTRLTAGGRWNVDSRTGSISGKLTGLRLDPETLGLVRQLVPLEPITLPGGFSTRIDQLDLHAHTDIAFGLVRGGIDDPVDTKLLFTVHSGRISLPGVRYRPTRLEGKLYCDTRYVQLKNFVVGDDLSQITLNGTLDRGTGVGRLEVAIRNLPFDERLHGSLPADWQRMLDTWRPGGQFDLTTTLLTSEAGRWVPTDSVLVPRGSTANHVRFPYPLEQVRGTMTQLGSSRDLRVELTAVASGRPVSFSGLVTNAGPAAASQLDLRVTQLPIDNTLLAACQPSLQRTLKAFSLRGYADISARFVRPRGENQPLRTSLAVRLNPAGIDYEHFRYPLDNLSGHITGVLTPGRDTWAFESLTARHGPARLTGHGSYVRQGTDKQLSLDITVHDVPLSADLKSACSPALKRLWDRYSPTGRLAAEIRIRRSGDARVQVSLPWFELTEGSLLPAGFPYRLDAVESRGRYHVDASGTSHLAIERLAARHGPTRLKSIAAITVERNGDWTARFDPLSTEGLQADVDFRRALPAGLREIVTALDPQKTIDLAGMIELRGAGDPGFPLTAAWNLNMKLAGGRITAGVHLDDVHGRIHTRGQWFGRHAEIDGQLDLDSVKVWGYRFERVTGPFRLEDRHLVVGSKRAFESAKPGEPWKVIPLNERVTARAIDGLFTLDAQAQLVDRPTYHVKMNMSEARLERFAQLHLRKQRNLKGLMRGWVDLKGRGNDLDQITGRGQIQISPAALYELPIVVRLFEVLSLGPPGNTAFNYAQLTFNIGRGRFAFDSIDLVGKSLQLRGRGTARFDGRVDLDFYSMLPRSQIPIPLLRPLIAPLTTGWVAVRVTGKAGSPVARVRPAPALDDALKGFLAVLELPPGRLPPPLRPPPTSGQILRRPRPAQKPRLPGPAKP